MKKFLFLIALFALMGGVNSYATKKYATYGTPDSKGSWNAGTGTYTWTEGYSNLMPIFEFPNGELADYKSLHLTTSDYTGAYRICFMNGGTLVATIAFYSAGQKDLVFSERTETKDIDLSKITHISFGGASGSGSIVVANTPYLEKPTSLSFNDAGKAYFDLSDVSVSGATLSYDDKTGVLTSTGTSGSIRINFDKAYDLSSLSKWHATVSGDNIVNHWKLVGAKNNDSDLDMYSGMFDRTFPGSLADPNFTAVTGIEIFVNAEGSITFTPGEMYLEAGVITASDPSLYNVTTMDYCRWDGAGADAQKTGEKVYPANEVGKAMGQGSTIYGDGNVYYLNYVNLTGYNSLKVKASAGAQIRICMNRPSDGGTLGVDLTKTVDSDGYATFDLTGYEYSHLHAIKFPYNGQTHTVYSIEATNPDSKYDYVISGSGIMTSVAKAALADASATSYDATGVTGTSVDLSDAANANALFVANAGVLSNTSNVIVSDACANLALTDGNYPFKAPADFTATNVSYNRNFTAGTRSTVCLPFALTAAEAEAAGTFYELSGVNPAGTELTFNNVTSNGTTAYKPYIFEAKTDGTPFTGYSSKAIVATPATFTGETVDGYTLTGVLAGSSDVAADNEGKTVYGWSGNSGKEGTFVKVGTGVAIDPFRAYVVYNGTGGTSSARMAARFIVGSITGIDEVPETQEFLNPDGKYIENGKIVIVKNGVKYNAAGQQVK